MSSPMVRPFPAVDPGDLEREPTDEELGWWDEDDIPVNIFGEEID